MIRITTEMTAYEVDVVNRRWRRRSSTPREDQWRTCIDILRVDGIAMFVEAYSGGGPGESIVTTRERARVARGTTTAHIVSVDGDPGDLERWEDLEHDH